MFDWDEKTSQAFWVIVGYISDDLSIEITPNPVSIIGKCAQFAAFQIQEDQVQPDVVSVEVICGLLMLAENKNKAEKNILISKSCESLRQILINYDKMLAHRRVPARSKPEEPVVEE